MKPFFYTVSTNFGDYMNSWLWPALIPDLLNREDDVRLIGIGSLLSRNLDLVQGRKVVFGTGSGYSSLPSPEQARKWRVYCVRGPLTAKFLGLDPSRSITDGAWLINQIPEYAKVPTSRHGTVFVPHWTSAKFGKWEPICERANIRYVDPLWDCSRVFSSIAHAELAIVESLHGAIIADYYRTPWIPVVSPSRILKFKWLDWCGSLGLSYEPYYLPPSDYVDCLFQRVTPGNAEADIRQIDVPVNEFDIKHSSPPPAKAGVAYHAKGQVKSMLRMARNSGMDGLSKIRNSMPFRNWNQRHSARMETYFSRLQNQVPFLSVDSARTEAIERLNGRLEELKDDFRNGLI